MGWGPGVEARSGDVAPGLPLCGLAVPSTEACALRLLGDLPGRVGMASLFGWITNLPSLPGSIACTACPVQARDGVFFNPTSRAAIWARTYVSLPAKRRKPLPVSQAHRQNLHSARALDRP